jgi:hypothetical protein
MSAAQGTMGVICMLRTDKITNKYSHAKVDATKSLEVWNQKEAISQTSGTP